MRRLGVLNSVLVILLWAGCAAQKSSTPPDEGVRLFDNLGSHHHAITTRSPEAQQYFDQGLRLIWAFNHDEATRAFQEATRLDPDCAMAWWGIALAAGPNYNDPGNPERLRRCHARGLAPVLR